MPTGSDASSAPTRARTRSRTGPRRGRTTSTWSIRSKPRRPAACRSSRGGPTSRRSAACRRLSSRRMPLRPADRQLVPRDLPAEQPQSRFRARRRLPVRLVTRRDRQVALRPLKSCAMRGPYPRAISLVLSSPSGTQPRRRVSPPLAAWTRHSAWTSGPWFLRSEHLFLIPGDSAIGYRLPLGSLPWSAPEDVDEILETNPFARRDRRQLAVRAELSRDGGARCPV